MAYIKDSIIACFKKQLCELEHNPDKFSRVKAKFLKNYVIASLEASKTDDVVEVKQGYWINHYSDLYPADCTQECSICHAEEGGNLWNDNYCPNCGARMDGRSKT
jgi:hypothetical protein